MSNRGSDEDLDLSAHDGKKAGEAVGPQGRKARFKYMMIGACVWVGG